MTIELTANPIYEPVSYEGEHCPVHMVQVITMTGIVSIDCHAPIETWQDYNHYDCNLRHAFKTLQGMHGVRSDGSEGRVEVKTLRVVLR